MRRCPDLFDRGLVDAFEYWVVRMDDRTLGLWAGARIRASGALVYEEALVERIGTDGTRFVGGRAHRFNLIVNRAGLWTESNFSFSGALSCHRLQLVHGSHIVFSRACACGVRAEVAESSRIAFLLQWKSRTLVGTTKVRQELKQPIE